MRCYACSKACHLRLRCIRPCLPGAPSSPPSAACPCRRPSAPRPPTATRLPSRPTFQRPFTSSSKISPVCPLSSGDTWATATDGHLPCLQPLGPHSISSSEVCGRQICSWARGSHEPQMRCHTTAVLNLRVAYWLPSAACQCRHPVAPAIWIETLASRCKRAKNKEAKDGACHLSSFVSQSTSLPQLPFRSARASEEASGSTWTRVFRGAKDIRPKIAVSVHERLAKVCPHGVFTSFRD